jgi:protocatechuate 3,4-dioxygenase, alpha subunit
VTSGAANAANPVLALVPAHRTTLIATRGNAVYSLDAHLQGDNETAFFEV